MIHQRSDVIAEPIGTLFRLGSAAGLSDSQLLGRFISEQDEAAFAALVGRHGPMVLAVCRQLVKDSHDAEDAFQATFLVLARRADSLRDPELLGHWLYRVAKRSAQKANALRADRQRRQAREIAMPRVERTGDVDSSRTSWEHFEDFEALHQEIDRLPERYRVPVVLCYMEGLSHAEVAQRLQKHVGTVGVVLSRARRLLRERLTRRGIAVPAAFLIVGRATSTAKALPPTLASSTAAAAVRFVGPGATATAIPQAAAAIAEGVLRNMFTAYVKTTAAVILIVGGIVGIGAGIVSSKDGKGPAGHQARAITNPTVRMERPAGDADDAGTITVRGEVVDPTGRPVAGATVHFCDLRAYFRFGDRESSATTVSGADGRFALEASRRAFDQVDAETEYCPTRVIASAPGFGISWCDVPAEAPKRSRLSVRLVEDDVPIEGRILDLEGRPVAGAKASVHFLWAPSQGDLVPWIEKVKTRTLKGMDNLEPIPVHILPRTQKLEQTTGPDGRFRLQGIGHERVVTMLISGSGIETSTVEALTRNGPDLLAIKTGGYPNRTIVYHGARFAHASERSRPIEGTIRDKDTGVPIAGITVQGMVYEEHSALYAEGVETVTDERGQYQLLGLAQATEYRLLASPSKGQPYPDASFHAKAGVLGTTPLTYDMALKRGVLVHGRLTDKVTGRSVIGRVSLRTANDNPHQKDYPNLESGERYVSVGPDGHFEIAALPGPSLLGAWSIRNRYLGWVGIDAIEKPERYGVFRLEDGSLHLDENHVLTEINPAPGTSTITRDLQVDPGRDATVTIVGPNDQPIVGVQISGRDATHFGNEHRFNTSTIRVHALDPANPRRLRAYHPGHRLAGSLLLRGDEGKPLTLKLRPTGAIVGRLVDTEGKPFGKLLLGNRHFGGYKSDLNRALIAGPITVGEDGRFRVEGLVPDLKYATQALKEGMRVTTVFEDIVVGSGETRDLGDIVISPVARNP